MKKAIYLTLIILALASCNDLWNDDENYSAYKPLLMPADQFVNAIHLTGAQTPDTVGKLAKLGDYLLAMETYYGLHIFNIADSGSMTNENFLFVPGIIDFEVKDSIIYANSATDLVTFKFYDANNIEVLNRQPNVFYELLPPDHRQPNPLFVQGNRPENTVIVAWVPDNDNPPDPGIFPYNLIKIYGDYLYTAYGQNLLVFDIASDTPRYVASFQGNYNFIEKFDIKGSYLYTFSLINMQVLSLSPPDNPVPIKEYSGINCASYFDMVYGTEYKFFVTYHVSPYYYSTINSMQIYNLGTFNTIVLDTAIGMQYPLDINVNDTLIYVCDYGIKTFLYTDDTLAQVSYIPGDDLNIFRYDSVMFTLGEQYIHKYFISDTTLEEAVKVPINFAWTIRY